MLEVYYDKTQNKIIINSDKKMSNVKIKINDNVSIYNLEEVNYFYFDKPDNDVIYINNEKFSVKKLSNKSKPNNINTESIGVKNIDGLEMININDNTYIQNYGLTGNGYKVGVVDDGAVFKHKEFENNNRVKFQELDSNGNITSTQHATHVAGTIGAQGNDPTAKGVAPEVDIYSFDFYDPFSNFEYCGNNDINAINNSWGSFLGWYKTDINGVTIQRYYGISYSEYIKTASDKRYLLRASEFGNYDIYSERVDKVANDYPKLSIVFAVGNDRNEAYDSTVNGGIWHILDGSNWLEMNPNIYTPPASDGQYDVADSYNCAKNIISVGAAKDESVYIYVDSGSFTDPYYRFYLNDNGTNEVSTLYTGNSYVFKRTTGSTSHPFFISDNGYGKNSSKVDIQYTSDTSPTNGISGNGIYEWITLNFNNKTKADVGNLYYYCTSHNTMIKAFNLQDGHTVTSFSNYGPTDDLRIRPDVIAKGDFVKSCNNTGYTNYIQLSGTSMATPFVTGCCILIQQFIKEQLGYFPESSLVKACLIHTAVAENVNPIHGYGLVDMNKTLKLLDDVKKSNNAEIVRHIIRNTSDSIKKTIDISSYDTSKGGELIVTLVYNDPKGDKNADKAIVNKLGLYVKHGDNCYYPYRLEEDKPYGNAKQTKTTIYDSTKLIDYDNTQKIKISPNLNNGNIDIIVKKIDSLIEDQNYSLLVSHTFTEKEPGIIITETGGSTSVSESGTTDTFTVKLSSQPTSNVILNITSANTNEVVVSPSILNFTNSNWNTEQIVSVTGVNDNTIDENTTTLAKISIDKANSDKSYNNVTDQTVSIINININDDGDDDDDDNYDDIAGFTVNKNTIIVNESGTAGNFTVKLTAQPLNNVSFNILSADTSEVIVSPTTLTFTNSNWNTEQKITVTGVDDLLTDGSIDTNITVSVNKSNSDDKFDNLASQIIKVSTNDNDIAGFTLNKTSLFVSETGIKDDFLITLNRQPVNNVIFDITSDDDSVVTVSPQTVTFSSKEWNTGKKITVSNVDNVSLSNSVIVTVSINDTSDAKFINIIDQTLIVQNKMNNTQSLSNLETLINNFLDNKYKLDKFKLIEIYDIFCLKTHSNSLNNKKSCRVYIKLNKPSNDYELYYSFPVTFDVINNKYIINSGFKLENFASDIWNGLKNESLWVNIYSNSLRPIINNYVFTNLGELLYSNLGVKKDMQVTTEILNIMNVGYNELHKSGIITRGLNLKLNISKDIKMSIDYDKMYKQMTLFLIPEYIFISKIQRLISENKLKNLLSYVALNHSEDKMIVTYLTYNFSQNLDLVDVVSFHENTIYKDININPGISRINKDISNFWYNLGLRNKSYSYNELQGSSYDYIPILTFCNDSNPIDLVNYSNFNLHIGDKVNISSIIENLKNPPLINLDNKSFKNSIIEISYASDKDVNHYIDTSFIDEESIKYAIGQYLDIEKEYIKINNITNGSIVVDFTVYTETSNLNNISQKINDIYDDNKNIKFKNAFADAIGSFDNKFSIIPYGDKVDNVTLKENIKLKITIR